MEILVSFVNIKTMGLFKFHMNMEIFSFYVEFVHTKCKGDRLWMMFSSVTFCSTIACIHSTLV